MGKPKFSRKKYETPSHPWQAERINAENELTKKYGLKNKKEIWKAQTSLRRYRGQARELLAKIDSDDPQIKKESNQLLLHLTRFNILPINSTLDDVLALEVEVVLSRRLQTLTYLRGFANTPSQARQLISHGHIEIDGRKINVPGYLVTKNEEDKIDYIKGSPLNDTMHPARPSSDFKSNFDKKIEERKIEDKNTIEKITEKKEDSDKKLTKEEKPEDKQKVKKEDSDKKLTKEEKPDKTSKDEEKPEDKQKVKKEELRDNDKTITKNQVNKKNDKKDNDKKTGVD